MGFRFYLDTLESDEDDGIVVTGVVVGGHRSETQGGDGSSFAQEFLSPREDQMSMEFQSEEKRRELTSAVRRQEVEEEEETADRVAHHEKMEVDKCNENEDLIEGPVCVQSRRNRRGGLEGFSKGESIQACWEGTWMHAEFVQEAMLRSDDGYDFWVKWDNYEVSAMKREDLRSIDVIGEGLIRPGRSMVANSGKEIVAKEL